MWLVTQHGFYNIIQYEEDKEKDLLTVKARRKADLQVLLFIADEDIETSEMADYRYRVKAPRRMIMAWAAQMVGKIDYPKFKSRIVETPSQRDRHDVYLNVWDTLYTLQETEHENDELGRVI